MKRRLLGSNWVRGLLMLSLAPGCGRLNFESVVDAGSPDEPDAVAPPDVADASPAPPPTWIPVNIDAALLAAGSGPLLIGTQGSAVLDTDSGMLRRQVDNVDVPMPGVVFTVVAQAPPSPELAVFSATEVAIDAGVTLHVIGKRALVFASGSDIRITGVLSVRGGNVQTNVHTSRSMGGPGGYSCCDAMNSSHRGPGAPAAINSDGGAGHLHPGGKGSAGTAGGSAAGNPSLVPLIGGSAGGSNNNSVAVGGGGGGAVQLAALRAVRIEASGGVHAGAAGGSNSSNSRGGGGAGGAVLLDAAAVEVLGKLIANGGGGSSSSANGEYGRFDAMPAVGGGALGVGYGGAGDALPTDGAVTSGNTAGGGSAGRIKVRSWLPSIDTNALVSPSQASGGFNVEQVNPN